VDPGLSHRGWHLGPKDNRAGLPLGHFGNADIPRFHCEIEGTVFDDYTTQLLAYFTSLLILGLAALVIAIAGVALGPLGIVIFVLIFLIVVASLTFSLTPSPDVPEAPAVPVGSSTPDPNGPVITDTGGNSIKVDDCIAVLGRHVCDTGHHGVGGCWNELHPVLAVTRVDHATYDGVPEGAADPDFDKLCTALQEFLKQKGPITHGLRYLEHPALG
jgi:hypothetical protein